MGIVRKVYYMISSGLSCISHKKISTNVLAICLIYTLNSGSCTLNMEFMEQKTMEANLEL